MIENYFLYFFGFSVGERLIQYASENLVTEVLIHPQYNTLIQCMRNMLSSFTRHRHIINAGYTFSGNGSWILQVMMNPFHFILPRRNKFHLFCLGWNLFRWRFFWSISRAWCTKSYTRLCRHYINEYSLCWQWTLAYVAWQELCSPL